MKVDGAQTDGSNYQLHVYQSVEDEVLDEIKVDEAMKLSEISGKIEITGWNGIHFVITTTNSPSLEKIHLFCSKIKKIEPFVL